MPTVSRLYAVDSDRITVYTPDKISPEEFQSLSGIETNLYISIIKDNGHRVGLDYSRMITEQILPQANTWSGLAASMTDALYLGYKCNIPGYNDSDDQPTNPLVSWDVLGCTNTFDVTYADAYSGLAGTYAFKWRLHDLQIGLQDNINDVKPELRNCIPVINGFICRPYWNDKYLYARNGAELCYNASQRATPEIMLMDFANLGDISIHPLYMDRDVHGCFKVSFTNRTHTFGLNADWLLSTDLDLYDYTPIVVLMGLPIFPDKLWRINEHTLRIEIHDIPFNKALALKTYITDTGGAPSGVAYTSEMVEKYLKDQLSRDDDDPSTDCFVILVKTPKLYVKRVGTDVWRNGISIDVYAEEGLLKHDRTGCIINYHCDTYTTRKELTIQNTRQVYIADESFLGKQISMIEPDCGCFEDPFILGEVRHHNFQNLFHGNCTMIYLFR